MEAAIIYALEFLFDDDDFQLFEKGPHTRVPLLLALHREERHKVRHYVEDVVHNYLSDDFQVFFRVSRTTYTTLLDYLSEIPELQPREPAAGRKQIPLSKSLLMTLWYMGNQETMHSIADRFNVSLSTFLCHLRKMVSILCERLIAKLIYWPPEAERQAVIERFKAKRQFPGTLGALDGSHIRIRKPAERSNDYFNRKGYYSVILQAVCREDKRFIDIYCGWPGKVHDARVYRNSPLSHRLHVLCGVNHIVADGAYPLTGNLLTPYRNNGHLTNQQQSYNTALSGTRVLIENAFGMLKNRFRRLQCIDMIDIEYIVKTITVACILHNLCILNKDDLPDELHANDNGDCDNCFGPNVNDTREGVLKRLLITRGF